MYRECPAELSMLRVILGEGYFDDTVYVCEIIKYIPEQECIYLISQEGDLPDFSLDALYKCRIRVGNDILKCEGFITERYISKVGKVLVMQIKNGFYKNPVN